jgi:hypothetical protein
MSIITATTRMVSVVALASLALVDTASFAGHRSSLARLDPRPYQRVCDFAEWRGPSGRTLAFALLGYEHEPGARVIAVYESTAAGWIRLFLDHERGFHPWAIRLAELDGDSLPEVGVGVYKTSRFDPVLRRRLFVFDWTAGDTLIPKWLGSRLAYPFTSFMFQPAGQGRSRLVTTETHRRGGVRCVAYDWNGFGFSLADSTIQAPGGVE